MFFGSLTTWPARALLALGLSLAPTLGWCAPAAPAAPAPSAAQVRSQAEAAVKVRQESQGLVDQAFERKLKAMDRIEALERELEQVAAQRAKTEAYRDDQRAKQAALERRLEEAERLGRELAPLLDQYQARLADLVARDLPFLPIERAQRLAGLGEVLSDYDAGLAEKTRRVLEALLVEARYGATVGVSQEERDLAGRDLRVRVLRLGRVGLFALSPAGDQAWRWQASDQAWQPVDAWARDLERAAAIAQRQRVVELVEVPLGTAPPAAPAAATEAPAAPAAPAGEGAQ